MGSRGLDLGPTASKGSCLTISRSDIGGNLGEPLITAKQGSMKRSARLWMSSILPCYHAGCLLWFQSQAALFERPSMQASGLFTGPSYWPLHLSAALLACETVVWTSTSAACRAKRPVSSASGPTRPPSNAVLRPIRFAAYEVVDEVQALTQGVASLHN
jgi:hypothetical protein